MKLATFLSLFILLPYVAEASECVALCAADDPKCIIALNPTSPNAGNVESAFSELYDLLGDPAITAIPSKKLMSLFGITSDPCLRSDTLISTLPPTDGKIGNIHRIFNTGGYCRVSASVSLPSGSTLGAAVLVPDVLELHYTVGKDSVTINPALSSRKSRVVFSDEDFNIDFGGIVREISFSQKFAVIDTEDSCIALYFGDEK